MSTLTLKTEQRTIEIDLGDAKSGLFDGETLGGNVYLYVDGVEFGSIFVHKAYDGQQFTDETQISLGQYDDGSEEWEERARIKALPEAVQIPISRPGFVIEGDQR